MAQSTHHRHYRSLLDVLRQAREELGVSQSALGERLGNTQTFVSKVERGERRLDVAEFVEWCQALGAAPEDVFNKFLLVRGRGRGSKLRSSARAQK
ncbi:helix-turn-helix domain-containing protein [Dokdonella sp. MW10]|uniref:helix-turn-helix domain-containing protein n=1 Tax=Dokdonella sp. MW10 TaxID=2992926 RepID=UPI003F8229B2